MSTVGYGDYYARTIPGRFVSLIASIIGVFLVSSMVVALASTLNMSDSEAKARTLIFILKLRDNVINRLKARGEVSRKAASVLTKIIKLYLAKNKGHITTKK